MTTNEAACLLARIEALEAQVATLAARLQAWEAAELPPAAVREARDLLARKLRHNGVPVVPAQDVLAGLVEVLSETVGRLGKAAPRPRATGKRR